MISGRRRSVIFFTVLGICLVVLAVTLNVSWIVLNWRRGVLAILGVIFFLADHRRHRPQHDLPGARDPPQRAARLLHQRRHPRAEDAGRVDPPVPADAADARARRRQAARVLPHHAGGQRPAAAHDRSGAARRQRRARGCGGARARASTSRRSRASAWRSRGRGSTSSTEALAYDEVAPRSRTRSCSATPTS